MFVDRLFNASDAPMLEQMLRFTASRQKLLAENIVNISTPNYQQKDLDVAGFQRMLADRVEQKRDSAPGSVGFSDIDSEVQEPRNGILFHDGQNRSMEQLMTDQAKNALMHNVVIEMLRKQFQTMEMALKDHIS
jgi:flagellar basal-body rod protein FlgB